MNATDIIERLKSHLEIRTNIQLSEILGISPNTLSTWKKRNKVDYDLIFSKIHHIDLNWLIHGEQNISLNSSKNISTRDFSKIKQQGSNLPVVLIPEKASAGYNKGFSNENTETLPVIQFKDYKDGHRYRCFEVSGDSMAAYIHSGDQVFCEKTENLNGIKEGAIYVVNTPNDLFCKRLEVQEKELLLHSENQNYSVKSIDKKEVKEIWKVIWIHRLAK